MALNKFEDFEHNLEEEDKNALANDHVNASKDLVNRFDKIVWAEAGKNPGEVIIQIGSSMDAKDDEQNHILVKVIGYIA